MSAAPRVPHAPKVVGLEVSIVGSGGLLNHTMSLNFARKRACSTTPASLMLDSSFLCRLPRRASTLASSRRSAHQHTPRSLVSLTHAERN